MAVGRLVWDGRRALPMAVLRGNHPTGLTLHNFSRTVHLSPPPSLSVLPLLLLVASLDAAAPLTCCS